MTDKKKTGSKGGAMGQPLDATDEMFGDPTGLTGITKKPTNTTGRRLTPELYDDEEYDKNTNQGMSQAKAHIAEDRASEDDIFSAEEPEPSNEEPYLVNKKDAAGNDAPGTDYNNTSGATFSQPEHLGEQAISGSTPDPTADDDTLAAAQAMGSQMNEDDEHPQELNVGRDIDEAEESLRTH